MRSGRAIIFTVCAAVFAVGCGDEGPVVGAGTLTAVVTSPYGDEGAALLTVVGPGIEEIGQAGSSQVYANGSAGRFTVVLINEPGGELSFSVALADTTQKPTATFLEVAAPNDTLRTALDGYSVEYRR